MMLHKLFDWIFSGSENDQPYKWKLGERSKMFTKNSLGYRSEEKKIYKERAERSIKESMKIISSDGWRIETVSEYGVVYSKRHNKYGKIFKSVGILRLPPQTLNNELFHNIEKCTDWNVCVRHAKVLRRIDESTDIAQIVTSKVPFVSSRDFINLRHVTKIQDTYVYATGSVNYSAAPVNNQYVRGEQRFCTYIIKPIPGSPNTCELTWLLHTNLKGQLPQWVIDRTMCGGMLDHLRGMKTLESKNE